MGKRDEKWRKKGGGREKRDKRRKHWVKIVIQERSDTKERPTASHNKVYVS